MQAAPQCTGAAGCLECRCSGRIRPAGARSAQQAGRLHHGPAVHLRLPCSRVCSSRGKDNVDTHSTQAAQHCGCLQHPVPCGGNAASGTSQFGAVQTAAAGWLHCPHTTPASACSARGSYAGPHWLLTAALLRFTHNQALTQQQGTPDRAKGNTGDSSKAVSVWAGGALFRQQGEGATAWVTLRREGVLGSSSGWPCGRHSSSLLLQQVVLSPEGTSTKDCSRSLLHCHGGLSRQCP